MTRFLQMLAQRNDLLLAFLLISIVFMMILPLPTEIIDFLIGVNLSLAAILLMAAMYLKDVVQLSAFPSILLLTTLFRLSLNVASTRLILTHGHGGDTSAGQVIKAFGDFVMGGNFIIGVIVFVIRIMSLKKLSGSADSNRPPSAPRHPPPDLGPSSSPGGPLSVDLGKSAKSKVLPVCASRSTGWPFSGPPVNPAKPRGIGIGGIWSMGG